jgi:sugar phosphate isomerase/epimerase
MNLSCCVWALPGPESQTLPQLARLGFQWIDIQPGMLTTPQARDVAGALGLQVVCIGAAFGMPQDAALDSLDGDSSNKAIGHIKQALQHAALLGATTAYIVPGMDAAPAALKRYAQSVTAAATFAADLGIKFCIEHFPGRALPTASATLEFINQLGHPNLYLLYDSGHIQMAGEEPAVVIKNAGPLLGYVHLDDNDGQGDLHWSLLDGVMTKDSLRQTFAALAEIGYEGAVSLELNPNLPNPLESLRQSRAIVLDVLQSSQSVLKVSGI